MNTTYKIRLTGGTAVITIPESILREASLKVGDKLFIELTPSNHVLMRRANQDLEAARKRRYCPNCGCETNQTDIDAGYCTNCKEGF